MACETCSAVTQRFGRAYAAAAEETVRLLGPWHPNVGAWFQDAEESHSGEPNNTPPKPKKNACDLDIDCEKVTKDDPQGDKGRDYCLEFLAKGGVKGGLLCVESCAIEYAMCYSGFGDLGADFDAEHQEL